ncbi:hypothetical protein [Micromonospora sp. NBC_01638]|nr:hypothetical protein OG811_26680 [Micromonospora sp. NBC_01638]
MSRQMRMRGGSSHWTWRVVLLVLGTTPRAVDSDLIEGLVRKMGRHGSGR